MLAAATSRVRKTRSAAGSAARSPMRPLMVAAVAAGLALAGCARPAPPPSSDTGQGRYDTSRLPPYQSTRPEPPIAPIPPVGSEVGDTMKVALLLPLSGQHAAIGGAMLDAAQLAVFDMGTERFELVPKDTRGTPEGASAAASEAIGEGADLIVGPLLASSVLAASPAARAAGVPVLAFSNDRTVAGGGVFTLGFLPDPEVRRVVEYAVSQGMRRFAAVAPATPYGRLTVDALREAAAANSATVSAVEFISPNAGMPEITDLVRRVRGGQGGYGGSADASAQPDAVLLPMIGPTLTATASTMAFYEVDPRQVKFLGTGQWDQLRLSDEPSLVGSWYAAPDPAARSQFERKFNETYQRAPPRLATLAYDATALAAVLSGRSETGTFDQQTLTDMEGFTGLDGLFRFRPDGTAERGLAILQVTPSGVIVVDPAPKRFEDRIF